MTKVVLVQTADDKLCPVDLDALKRAATAAALQAVDEDTADLRDCLHVYGVETPGRTPGPFDHLNKLARRAVIVEAVSPVPPHWRKVPRKVRACAHFSGVGMSLL